MWCAGRCWSGPPGCSQVRPEICYTALTVTAGSVYADLQLQLAGMWGEIRDWRDGTTLVQKTHDPAPAAGFRGRAVVIVRSPYQAILSKHNYLYAGHTGTAPTESYTR